MNIRGETGGRNVEYPAGRHPQEQTEHISLPPSSPKCMFPRRPSPPPLHKSRSPQSRWLKITQITCLFQFYPSSSSSLAAIAYECSQLRLYRRPFSASSTQVTEFLQQMWLNITQITSLLHFCSSSSSSRAAIAYVCPQLYFYLHTNHGVPRVDG